MHSKLGEFSIYFYLIFFHGTILQPKTSFKLSYTANIFTSLSAPYDRFNSSPSIITISFICIWESYFNWSEESWKTQHTGH